MNKKIIIGSAIMVSVILTALIFLFFAYFGVLSPSNMLPRGKAMGQYESALDSGKYASSSMIAEGAGDAMYFQDYGTNAFVRTKDDRLSTFGLDVDTASYTVAKNFIMRGELPPPAAIRPEELINYFDYQYPDPMDKLGIYIEVAPSPFDEDIQMLRIGIKSRQDFRDKDAILTLVIDVSGSMNKENRLGLLKKSLRHLVEQLTSTDRVAIVKYNTQAVMVQDYTGNKQLLLDAIDSLSAQGSTNAEAGLKLGYSQADKAFRADSINRVIMLSDGVANVGNTSADSILSQLITYKQKGITLTAIGVGMGNYNDVLLEQLADKGDGNYYYINEFDEAKRVFQEQLSGTLQVIARDAKVQVDFNPDVVKRYRLIGYANREIADDEFRTASDGGEIGAGHQVTAIYELELKGDAGNLGKVYLRFTDPDTDAEREIYSEIYPGLGSFDAASDRFKMAVAVARFAQILKMSQPPPTIADVDRIVQSLEPLDDRETDFRDVIYNTKRLIEMEVSK
ncbi:MAG: von Willebrand factor type A domain-containing protein [Nanoarchaeota archaeon]|nr:von Willebrand factor type A domain-containing protein [Nanoarchaeota archaeon]